MEFIIIKYNDSTIFILTKDKGEVLPNTSLTGKVFALAGGKYRKSASHIT